MIPEMTPRTIVTAVTLTWFRRGWSLTFHAKGYVGSHGAWLKDADEAFSVAVAMGIVSVEDDPGAIDWPGHLGVITLAKARRLLAKARSDYRADVCAKARRSTFHVVPAA